RGSVVVRGAVDGLRRGVGVVDRVAVGRVADVRRIIVATAAADDSADRCSHDKRTEVTGRVTGLNVAGGGGHLRHVSHVVHRGTRRDGVNDLGYGTGCRPRALWSCGHEPHALEAEVINIADLDHFVRCVCCVLKGGAFNGHKL